MCEAKTSRILSCLFNSINLLHVFFTGCFDMCPYGLRQSIRCPKKYGETITERKYVLVPRSDLDVAFDGADSQKPLHQRYIRNAAVLPEPAPRHADDKATPCGVSQCQPGPLLIHGFTVAEYQCTYHAVVDPLLFTPCGKPRTYSLELGRHVKEHLFAELAYPTLQISEGPNGEVGVTERFCVLRPPPVIDVD